MCAAVWLLLTVGWPLVLAGRMETLYSWSQVDFTFKSNTLRTVYLASGQFKPENIIILDVDVYHGYEGVGRKIIVTTPKLKPGTPVTLSLVTDQRRNGTTLLQPYPDWSWHEDDTCDGITSVFRTKIDECGRLWVLDTGAINSFGNFQRICPTQILIFDLKTDELIRRHIFPESFLVHEALPITIVVDTRDGDCHGSFAYMADVNEYKLWVYSYADDESWRITNNYFFPYPFHGEFHINGEDFELMDGIFGLALGPVRSNGDRTLYFHSLASVYESWVSCSVIRNSSLFTADLAAAPRSFHVFDQTRSSQSSTQDMTDNGVLFYGLVAENAIGCWNSNYPFKEEHMDIVAKDDETLQFQTGLKVINNQVWSVSNLLQRYINGNLVPSNQVTQRINVGRVADLLRNTKCQTRQRPWTSQFTSLVFPSKRAVTRP